jgi:hypothetical protein
MSSASGVPATSGSEAAERLTKTLCGVYALCFVIGWLYKRWLLRRWKRAILEVLREQCAVVGEDLVRLAGSSASRDATTLVTDVWKRADNGVLEVYASGRRHVAGVLLRLDPVPREDVFTLIHDFLFEEAPDRLSIKAFISTKMERCVFALAKKHELKRLHVSYRELEHYTEQVTTVAPELSSEYGVLADTKELAQRILNASRVALLNRYVDIIQRLRFSDIYEDEPQDDDEDAQEADSEKPNASVESREPPGTLHPSSWSQVVHLQLALPVNLESLSEVLRFFFDLVDEVATMRMSHEAQHATQALRELVQRERQKRLNRARAKEEKEKAEERVARFEDAERRRRERREYRRRARSQRAPLRIFF